jgi:hypothetical protein
VSQATVAPGGTVAGRPQPQTTAEPAGGPFVRHAPDGRRAQYVATTGFSGFLGLPTVSMPGYCKGYKLQTQINATNTATPPTLVADFPDSFYSLVQMKDAFGTQLLTGPGYNILREVNLYSGQFGLDLMRDPQNSPVQNVYNTAASSASTITFSRYISFEFAKAYGVISGANAALLPVLQLNTAATSGLFSANPPTTGLSAQETLDSDFYWLPSAPTDPPGLGTTCQWILQPCNPAIPSAYNGLVQLPRMGGYLTMLILELRGSTGLRQTADGSGVWPARPKIVVDGVPLIDTLMTTWFEDIAISTGIGAGANYINNAANTTQTGTIPVQRPSGTIGINRKTSLSQRDFGLLDTGEIFLNTNPGTQLEMAGYPWGTQANAPSTLNAIVGQVVPSGQLVQGLPEV